MCKQIFAFSAGKTRCCAVARFGDLTASRGVARERGSEMATHAVSAMRIFARENRCFFNSWVAHWRGTLACGS
jgi:hypothetical protein